MKNLTHLLRITTLLICVFALNIASAQSGLITQHNDAIGQLSTLDLIKYQKFGNLPLTETATLVKLNSPKELGLSLGEPFTFSLLGQTAHTFKPFEIEYYNENDYFWYADGVMDESNLSGDYIFLFAKGNESGGEVSIGGELYFIYPLNDTFHVLVKAADSQGTLEDDVHGTPAYDPTGSCVFGTESCTIDLLVFYTPDMTLGIMPISPSYGAYQVLYQARSAFLRSRIRHRINLVSIELFNDTWVSGVNAIEDLAKVKSSFDSPFSSPRLVKDRIKPDIVVVLTSGLLYPIGASPTGRVADIPATSQENNYLVAAFPWAANNSYTAVHEIGHLFGGRHQNDDTNIPARAHVFSTTSSSGSEVIRETVMHSSSQTPILNFSNPDVKYNGVATGTETRNNACVIQAEGCTIANIGTPDACFLDARSDRDCFGNLRLAARYINLTTMANCAAEYVRFETSLDGFTYTDLGLALMEEVLITVVPPLTPIVYIRATALVGLVPATTTIIRANNPCPPIPPDGSKLSNVLIGLESTGITIFPNPVTDFVFVEFNEDGLADLAIFNQLGQCVLRRDVLANESQRVGVDVHAIPAGNYTIRCMQAGVSYVAKMQKL